MVTNTNIFRSACVLLLIAAVFALVSACPTPASADMSPGDLIWAKVAVGPGYDDSTSVAELQDGSLMTMGTYENTLTIGAGEVGETTLPPRAAYHPFLANYSADGSLLGAGKVAGPNNYGPNGRVAALPDGGYIITGQFYTEAIFDDTTLFCLGDRETYIARYNASHQLLWAKRAGKRYTGGGGFISTQVEGLAAFSDGSCLITGMFFGQATFGQGEVGEITIYSANELDAFVARYNPDGTVAWAKGLRDGGHGSGWAKNVAIMPDGGCAVTGYFNSAPSCPFIARLLPDGTESWIKWPVIEHKPGSPSPETARGKNIAAFSDGSCVVTGSFTGNLTLGSGEANETMIATGGSYLAKYNLDGTLAWATRPPIGGGRVVSLSDGMLITGGGSVAKLSADGTVMWERRDATLSAYRSIQDVTVLPGGGYALLGTFSDTLTFPQNPGVTFQGSDDGKRDIFLATFYDPSVMPAAPFGPVPPPPPPPASGPEFISEEFRVASDGWSGIYALNYATAEDWWTGSVFGEYAFPTSLPLGEWIGLSIYNLEAGTWEEGVYLYKEEWD